VIFRHRSVYGEIDVREIIGYDEQVIEQVVIMAQENSTAIQPHIPARAQDHGGASFGRLSGRVAGRSPAVQEVRVPAFGGARQSLVNFLDRSSATC
jgi:hypothetical protein